MGNINKYGRGTSTLKYFHFGTGTLVPVLYTGTLVPVPIPTHIPACVSPRVLTQGFVF